MAKTPFDPRDPDAPPPSEAAVLAGYFSAAAERMKAIVLHPPGRTRGAQDFALGRAANQLAQVRRIHKELTGRAFDWTGKTLSRAYRRGLAIADAQLKSAGVLDERGAVRGSFSLIDPRIAGAFAADTARRRNASETAGDLKKAADSMAGRANRVIRETAQRGLNEDRINEVLAAGTIDGKRDQTIKALRDELKAVHGETVNINGRDFEVGYYARMVAITKIRQATEIARHGRMADLGLDLVVIVGRESDNPCTEFLGKVFSLSGAHPKYQPLSSLPGGGPPFHPNCSKSTAPFVEELATDAQVAASEPEPETEKISEIWKRSPSQAAKAFKDLQRRQDAEQRGKNINASLTRK